MATADLISELQTDLTNAYAAVSDKGGTVPEQKNSNNLASAINSISGGGGGQGYNIPEFDGGEYGAIAYFDGNNEVKYHTITSSDTTKLGYSNGEDPIITSPDGTEIYHAQVLAFSIGTNTQMPDSNFLTGCVNLRFLYGTEHLTTIGPAFLSQCYSFNQALTLPEGITTIGDNFLAYCCLFNSPLTLPSTITTIGISFMCACASFNQPLTLPEALTSIGSAFMNYCLSFAQPLTIPPSITTAPNRFLSYIRDFVGPLNVNNTAPSAAVYGTELATEYETGPSYTQGITIIGSTAQAWKDKFPDSNSSPYRKLIVGATPPSKGEYGTLYYTEDGEDKTLEITSEEEYQALAFQQDYMSGDGQTYVATIGDKRIEGPWVTKFAFNNTNGTTPQNFLAGCTNLTEIEGLDTAGLTSIGWSFLISCASFNQPITIPSTVTSISNSFLYGCTSFNSPITFNTTLTSIGFSFLYRCTAFNQPLDMSNTQIATIGDSMLIGCSNFSSGISLPPTLSQVGNNFLADMDAFTGPLNLGESTVLPSTHANTYDYAWLAVTNPSAPAYVTGITITGNNASQWISQMTNGEIQSPVSGLPTKYRKLIVGS